METKPTYEQAQLHLQLFEMRRESKLRQARDWYFQNYYPETFEQSMRIAAPGTEGGNFVMMVWSYWDRVCALLNYGLLHEDLFFETDGEFYGVWERVRPVIQDGRKQFSNKLFLENMEKAATRFEKWMENRSPEALATMRKFMEQVRTQASKGKAA